MKAEVVYRRTQNLPQRKDKKTPKKLKDTLISEQTSAGEMVETRHWMCLNFYTKEREA